jgi:hypothetical protein
MGNQNRIEINVLRTLEFINTTSGLGKTGPVPADTERWHNGIGMKEARFEPGMADLQSAEPKRFAVAHASAFVESSGPAAR